jgi:hypothetical protein
MALKTIIRKHMKHEFHLRQSCCIERGLRGLQLYMYQAARLIRPRSTERDHSVLASSTMAGRVDKINMSSQKQVG